MKKKNILIFMLLMFSTFIYAQRLEPVVNSTYNDVERSIWIILTNPTDKPMLIHNNPDASGGANSIVNFRFVNEAKEKFGSYREIFSLNGQFPLTIQIEPYSNVICKYTTDNIFSGIKRRTEIKSVDIYCFVKYSIPEKNIYGKSLVQNFNLITKPDLSIGSGYDSHNQVIMIVLTNTTSKAMTVHNTGNPVQFRYLTASGGVITTSYSALREQSGAFINPIILDPRSTKMFYYKYADMSQGISRKSEISTVEAVCNIYYDIPASKITRALQKKTITAKVK